LPSSPSFIPVDGVAFRRPRIASSTITARRWSEALEGPLAASQRSPASGSSTRAAPVFFIASSSSGIRCAIFRIAVGFDHQRVLEQPRRLVRGEIEKYVEYSARARQQDRIVSRQTAGRRRRRERGLQRVAVDCGLERRAADAANSKRHNTRRLFARSWSGRTRSEVRLAITDHRDQRSGRGPSADQHHAFQL